MFGNRRPVSPYVYPGLGVRRQGMIVLDFVYDCCDALGVSYTDMVGKSRKQDVVFARHSISHCLRTREKKSFADIGRIFNRDHATAINAVKRWDNLLWANDYKAQDINLVVMQVYKRHNFKFNLHE